MARIKRAVLTKPRLTRPEPTPEPAKTTIMARPSKALRDAERAQLAEFKRDLAEVCAYLDDISKAEWVISKWRENRTLSAAELSDFLGARRDLAALVDAFLRAPGAAPRPADGNAFRLFLRELTGMGDYARSPTHSNEMLRELIVRAGARTPTLN